MTLQEQFADLMKKHRDERPIAVVAGRVGCAELRL